MKEQSNLDGKLIAAFTVKFVRNESMLDFTKKVPRKGCSSEGGDAKSQSSRSISCCPQWDDCSFRCEANRCLFGCCSLLLLPQRQVRSRGIGWRNWRQLFRALSFAATCAGAFDAQFGIVRNAQVGIALCCGDSRDDDCDMLIKWRPLTMGLPLLMRHRALVCEPRCLQASRQCCPRA
jgi:hypothetical protein